MSRRTHLLSWRTLAALGAMVLLLALVVHPATATIVVGAAAVLLPVALFGLVLVPLALRAAVDWEPRLAVPALVRARLFQRPPPISLL